MLITGRCGYVCVATTDARSVGGKYLRWIDPRRNKLLAHSSDMENEATRQSTRAEGELQVKNNWRKASHGEIVGGTDTSSRLSKNQNETI